MANSSKSFLREGFLIVISILAALGVNEWRLWAKDKAELENAVISIAAEISDNRRILEGVPAYQQKLSQRIAQVAEGDLSGRTPMEVLTPVIASVSGEKNSFVGIDGVFQNVSWDIAKDRGVVARMEYETAKRLSFVNDTLLSGLRDFNFELADRFASSELHKPRDQKAFLMELSMRFAEAGSRAEFVEDYLMDAQNALEADYPLLLREDD